VTLTYTVDLDILKMYVTPKLQFLEHEQDIQTGAHTHTQNNEAEHITTARHLRLVDPMTLTDKSELGKDIPTCHY